MVIRYKNVGELLNEETAKERSANEVRVFTTGCKQLDNHRVGQMRAKSEKASDEDCKGSKSH